MAIKNKRAAAAKKKYRGLQNAFLKAKAKMYLLEKKAKAAAEAWDKVDI